MKHAQKTSLITATLLVMLTTSVGCVGYDDNNRYWSNRYDRYDRYGRLDLDGDGRVEQWERNRWDRDGDGRIEQWERNRGPSPYYGRDSDSRYLDRFDR